MADTKIEWTEKTWNPVTGCSHKSPGCDNCYAARMAMRLQAMGQAKYANGFEVTCHDGELGRPATWRKPSMVFVNSMGDLFHPYVPRAFIERVFGVMAATPRHTYQVLTKRARRLATLSRQLTWPENAWMGVSVESQDYPFRLDLLRETGAAIKFVSLEPLLGPLDNLDLEGIDWVIVGGESGPGARPMDPDWVRSIRDQCLAADVPFFMKQWGGRNKKKAGRLLDGRSWDEMPAVGGTGGA